jgi:hypothetical protein
MRLLLGVLIDPHRAAALDTEGWNRLLLEARYHGLVARLGEEFAQRGLSEGLPLAAQRQITAAMTAAAANQAALRFEIDRVRAALRDSGMPLMLLKGGAYLAAGLPCAQGRTACDLDILVPRDRLAEAEQALLAAGWEAKALDAYDDRYYREWMHELPPLWHPGRDMALDVHHTIFPPISRLAIDSADLLAAARPLHGGLLVLSPPDMVLHAALHLFGEDATNRLRDLMDLRDLVIGAAAEPGFWPTLLDRARALGAGWALEHALHHLVTLLDVPVPEPIRASVLQDRNPLRRLIRRMLADSLLGGLPEETGAWHATSQFCVYARSHWLRLPLPLLVRHLWIKLRRAREDGTRVRA